MINSGSGIIEWNNIKNIGGSQAVSLYLTSFSKSFKGLQCISLQPFVGVSYFVVALICFSVTFCILCSFI